MYMHVQNTKIYIYNYFFLLLNNTAANQQNKIKCRSKKVQPPGAAHSNIWIADVSFSKTKWRSVRWTITRQSRPVKACAASSSGIWPKYNTRTRMCSACSLRTLLSRRLSRFTPSSHRSRSSRVLWSTATRRERTRFSTTALNLWARPRRKSSRRLRWTRLILARAVHASAYAKWKVRWRVRDGGRCRCTCEANIRIRRRMSWKNLGRPNRTSRPWKSIGIQDFKKQFFFGF